MPEDTYQRMLPLLKGLEKRRRNYLLRVQRVSLILIGLGMGFAVLSLVMKLTDNTLIPLFLVVSAAVVLVMIGIFSYLSDMEGSNFLRKYQEIFRALLIPELLKTLEPGVSFDVKKGVSGKAFRSLQFFGSPHDQFSSSDRIAGGVEGVSFSISFVNSEIVMDTKGSTVTQFQGFFLMMDFHKEFKGRTYVLPDEAERLFGKAGRTAQKLFKRRHTNLLQLDDPEFEKAFAVYSTDEIEARYLLSHSMMRRFLKMRDRFGSKIRFSFRDSFVCIAIPTGRNYLVPGTNLPSTDENQFLTIHKNLRMLLGVVHDLDLTTRIWSKT